MSILVVCPGCRKSFKVSDKYAGKSGGCPNCRTTIKVPTKAEEVQVHAPEEFAGGGRSTAGKLITKPIARREIRLQPLMVVAIGGGALTVLLVSWAAGELIRSSTAVRVVGLLLVSPPLVLGAYSFLRDDELEPYRGTALYVRSAVCAVSYAALWGVYGYLAGMVLTGELWQWFFVAPPLLVAGALVALGCLDLSFGNGSLHYAFYVVVIILLRWTAGMGWVWEVGDATAL
jgi:hypothetical protein